MKLIVFSILLLFSFTTFSREWKSLKDYQKSTQNNELLPQDWLKSDRKHNTDVWQKANNFNLTNNKPEEYTSIQQRRDFYSWIIAKLDTKEHEVVWPKMAYYISKKLRLVEAFPYSIFTNKKVKGYANQGSEEVFFNSFKFLKEVYLSETVIKNEEALNWDKTILYEEQFVWIEDIYLLMDERSLKKIERMAKGKFLYSLVVPKQIRFEGDIANPQERFNYALNILKPYCISEIK